MKLYTVEQVWDNLAELGVATDEELKLITSINGYSIESLNDVIYARTGFNDYEQLIAEDEDNY